MNTPRAIESPTSHIHHKPSPSKDTAILSEDIQQIPGVGALQKSLQEQIAKHGNFGNGKQIYDFLTTRPEIMKLKDAHTLDLLQIAQHNAAQGTWYKKSIQQLELQYNGDGNPAWMGITCAGKGRPSETISYKWYRTIPLTRYAYTAHLPKLIEALKNEGEKKNAKISVKIPRSFMGFATHNDSMVIHSDSPDVDVDTILEKWAQASDIVFAERHLGRTTFAIDGARNHGDKKTSFSDLVVQQVVEHGNVLLGQGFVTNRVVDTVIQGAIDLSSRAPKTLRP